MLPFLRYIASHLTKGGMLLLVILHLIIYTCMPIINVGLSLIGEDALTLSNDFLVPLAKNVFFYTLLGYFLDKKINVRQLSKKNSIAIFIVTAVGILTACCCTYYQGITEGKFTQDYMQLADWLIAACVFLFTKRMILSIQHEKARDLVEKVFCFVGPLTFGMYLFDPCLKAFFYIPYQHIAEPILPTLVVSVGWVIASMVVGGIITHLFKKIRYIGELI